MKKLLLTLSVCAGIMTANAQQIEGEFDSFETGYNSVGVQPIGWKGSNVKQKVGLSVSKQMIFEDTGHSNKSVKMVNNWVGVFGIGSNAPAYITLGNPWVYATMTINEADGGTYGGLKFNYRPDALKGFIKRQLGSEKNEIAQVLVYSWKGTTSIKKTVSSSDGKNTETELIDRERDILSNQLGTNEGDIKSEDFELISYGEYQVSKDENITDWTEITIPIEYFSNNIPEKLNVIISSSDYFNRGNIGKDNTLWADNFKFIYYSELASLNYDGKNYFQAETTAYSIDAVYDKNKLTYTSNGKGATIETSYNEDEALLTITVKGNDVNINPENVHIYTVQFAKPQPEITEYENDLLVALNGQGTPTQKAKIQLIKELDGTTSLALNNFVLGSGDEALAVGNIKLTNLEIKDNKIQATQTINITEGDDPAYEGEWFGPQLGEVPVSLNATLINDQTIEAIIDIPLAPGFMEVKVTFAETQTYTEGNALNLTNGLTNFVYNRTFPAGWNTICLPFATTTAAFGEGVKAQAFISADNNGLNFGEVTELEANKPYLIYFKEAKETPTYFGTEITSTTPVSVTFGDFTFCGSYEASISMAGKYGVADQGDVQKLMLGGEGSTLKATRAYFTKSGDQPAMININLDGNATGIENIEQNQADIYDIYNLQGQLIRKNATSLNGLAKGIYIVNGKKVMVK
mgnify:FL=1